MLGKNAAVGTHTLVRYFSAPIFSKQRAECAIKMVALERSRRDLSADVLIARYFSSRFSRFAIFAPSYEGILWQFVNFKRPGKSRAVRACSNGAFWSEKQERKTKSKMRERKVHPLWLVKAPKWGPGDRWGSFQVLGFVRSFFAFHQNLKAKS